MAGELSFLRAAALFAHPLRRRRSDGF